jgi:hypothetical protein
MSELAEGAVGGVPLIYLLESGLDLHPVSHASFLNPRLPFGNGFSAFGYSCESIEAASRRTRRGREMAGGLLKQRYRAHSNC